MPDSFLYFFPRMGKKCGGGGRLSNFKSTSGGAMPFLFFPGRGHNYLLYLLMDSSSPPRGINNEWFLTKLLTVLQIWARKLSVNQEK